MKILILGGDGYLGWPAAMYFSNRGNEVAIIDNFVKRQWEQECGVSPLFPVMSLKERIKVWYELTRRRFEFYIGDLTNFDFVRSSLRSFKPNAIIHFGEQPSAPFSMMDQHRAVLTQTNNVVGSLNVLFAMRDCTPEAHLVKLGTMGEYGIPNIDIEEGFIEINHKGRKDILPFPKQAGSFYHLSKVHDSHNMMFACKIWNLLGTELNQGIVYGVETEESRLDERLATSFHYDAIFGTVLNRFCVEAVLEKPLTIYGQGKQKRSFLNIVDTLQCIELAILHPPDKGEVRVFNQFTEVFSICELADLIVKEATRLGFKVAVKHLCNPRVEQEEHYYNPKCIKLLDLGLKPLRLSNTLIDSLLIKIQKYKHRIKSDVLLPQVSWTHSKYQTSRRGVSQIFFSLSRVSKFLNP